MDRGNEARHHDSRDSRTQAGESAHPTQRRELPNESLVRAPADDPVTAVDPGASPSRYTDRQIEEGDTPLEEDMDMLVDPSIGPEKLSTNPDVLDLDESWRTEGEEPDFMDDPGTSDVIESVEEAEPYFPPIDPPIGTRSLSNARVRGGFASSSLEEPDEPEDEPLRVKGGDDAIEARVRYALRTDAYTSDLNIEVEVEDGVVRLHGKVRSIEDVEQAEQVAGSVEGVEDVEEELEII
ncbi:MAG TPA: BON domain-containing protein [Chloroflexia bacterium]|nr:BON domain-containing protein [Chloroflexia bacterium]